MSFFISIFGLILFSIDIFSFRLTSFPFNPGFIPCACISILIGSFIFILISSKFIPSCLGMWIWGANSSVFSSSFFCVTLFPIDISGFKLNEPFKFPLESSSGIIGWMFFNPVIWFSGIFTEGWKLLISYFAPWLLLPLFIKLKLPDIYELPLNLNFELLTGYSSAFFSSSLIFLLFLIVIFPFEYSPNLFGISKSICWSPLLGSISGSLKVGSWSIFLFSRSIFSKEGSFIPGKFFLSSIFIFSFIGISTLDDWIRGILKSYLLSTYLFFCI